MEYPLISEYREAILSAEDNFNELSSLRPVLDSHGDPVMSSGNFAVVFKMRDESDGKLYAVKCFIKDQAGRDESYRKIADELEVISSSYILQLRYLENELFVDSAQCDREEFPVVVMEWVEGETLDAYLNRNLNDKYELEMLSYRFNRMAAWLLAQPFAHGDLKPDNILVRKDGSLVLVDYDGMFVPSMKGEKAREIGSPDYRHPSRTDADFDEHIDDFSIAVIALSLKAISLNPKLKPSSYDSLLLNEKDYQSPSESLLLKEIQKLSSDSDLSMFFGILYIALAKNSLDSVSFRLFITDKPKQQKKSIVGINIQIEKIDTSFSDKDTEEGIRDKFGVIYSRDGKRLLKCKYDLTAYNIKHGTQIICDDAFSSCKSLLSVVIPDTVTAIGNHAFRWCSSLQSILIPESVTAIVAWTFDGCSSLHSVIIPDSVNTIEYGAFQGCSSLQSVKIPSSVTAIESRAFYGCSSLKSVVIPDSVTAIGNEAFQGCSSLKSVKIPDSVTVIGDEAFQGCSSLKSVKIPDSVTAIGDGAFSNCPKLSLILLSEISFKLIDSLLIDKSGRLISCLNHSEYISIPNSVTAIGNSAFFGCSSLQSITIPDSVTDIGIKSFVSCSSLKSFTFPNSITEIGEWTFLGCLSLQSVIIPDSVTYIGNWAFNGCSSLRSVIIPNSVTYIRYSAFNGCSSLQSVKIPDSVTAIEDLAFNGCSSLQSVIIPGSVTTIGHNTFNGCSSLQSVKIPDSVTAIRNRTFEGCSSLQSVIIPDSVTYIGDSAFNGCSSLQSVIIPDSVTTIGNRAFEECSLLETVTIPNSVNSIGNLAFSYCPKLSLILPLETTFRLIDNLLIDKSGRLISCLKNSEHILIPDSVTTIEAWAFSKCSSLQSVTIPDSVTHIGYEAFPAGCKVIRTH